MSAAKPAFCGDGAGGRALPGRAQPMAPLRAPNIMLSTRFATPLGYEAALARLGGYYQEQVGRKLPRGVAGNRAATAISKSGTTCWCSSNPKPAGRSVTIKRPTRRHLAPAW